MLLRFRFANYGSFRDETELSLVPTSLSHDEAFSVTEGEGERSTPVLPVLGVFGANASGKSTLVRALEFMVDAVRYSHTNWGAADSIPRQTFLLDPTYQNKPTLLEADFVVRNRRYQYGFEVTDKEVVAEWLYSFPYARRQKLFERHLGQYSFGKFLRGNNRIISEITRPNSLFLSAAATANHAQLSPIFGWFRTRIEVTTDRSDERDIAVTRRLVRNSKDPRVSDMLRHADLGIVSAVVNVEEMPEETMNTLRRVIAATVDPDSEDRDDRVKAVLSDMPLERESISLVHAAGGSGVPIPFDQESLGTRAWFALIGPILWALDDGKTVVVDELDASLHPVLMGYAIRMFANPTINPRHAQLVFTAHDTTPMGQLLDLPPLARDEVWFSEKDATGATTLYSLSEFRPRKGENLQRGYLQGRYGAIPQPSWLAIPELADRSEELGSSPDIEAVQ